VEWRARRAGAALAVAVMVVAAPAPASVPNPVAGSSPARAAVVQPGQPTAAPPAAPVAISLETPGTNERVSVADDESQLAGLESDQAAVTPDGRYVVFRAGLAGVGLAQQNDRILLRDRVAGATIQIYPPERFSTQAGPPKPPVLAEEPTISADGNMVAFTLTPGRAAAPRLILWRRGIGLSYPLVDENPRGDGFAASSFARAASLHPRLSADGGVLVFLAKPYGDYAADLVDGYYALTFSTGLIEAVSAKTGQTDPFPGPVEFGTAAVSADGNLVAFSSSHDFFYLPILSDFTPVLGNSNNDFGGYWGAYPSSPPGIYANPEGGTYDGRPKQIWLRNRLTRTTTLISSTPAVPGAVGDVPGGGDSDHPAMSADGRVIAFDSLAADLVPGDTNETTDVFVRAESASSRRVSVRPGGGQTDDSSAWPDVSTDGRLIAFASRATNLVPGDTNGRQAANSDRSAPYDIFLNGPAEDRLARVSVGVDGTEANGSSQGPRLAANGDLVVFDSLATNLVRDDTNQVSDVFARVREKPKPLPERKPAITANPKPVDFGVIVLGDLKNALQTVTITSVGTAPLSITGVSIVGRDAGDFLPVVDTCSGRTLPPGTGCSVGLLFAVATAPSRVATMLVANNSAQDPYPVPLRAERAEGPRLTLRPPSGPPGTVVVARGTGFPRNYPVTFTWSKGITPVPLALTQTDADGSFTAQMLVLPNDVVGPRNLRANVDLTGFESPTARFLVTRPTGTPPLVSTIQSFRDRGDRVIVLRR